MDDKFRKKMQTRKDKEKFLKEEVAITIRR